RMVTLRRARPRLRAAARPAKLPPTMMTSSMGNGSVGVKGIGLGLLRQIGKRDALEPGGKQGFGIGEEGAHGGIDGSHDAAGDVAGVAFGTNEQALAHGGIDLAQGYFTSRAQQAPATIMSLGGADNAGVAQLAEGTAHDDGIGQQALSEGGRGDGFVRLLVQMDKGMKGKGQAAGSF